jgi:uncharacterized protein involved in cysteine biosynthesis
MVFIIMHLLLAIRLGNTLYNWVQSFFQGVLGRTCDLPYASDWVEWLATTRRFDLVVLS